MCGAVASGMHVWQETRNEQFSSATPFATAAGNLETLNSLQYKTTKYTQDDTLEKAQIYQRKSLVTDDIYIFYQVEHFNNRFVHTVAIIFTTRRRL